uniref:30S ribosomal protein S20 n=1 Tax=Nocardia cyriacigeorgica TaxID=135487 RepID=UPI003CC8074A
MANIKSQMKRIRTNEEARQRNQSVKSALRTAIRSFREAAAAGDKDAAAERLRFVSRKLDKAASKGVIVQTRRHAAVLALLGVPKLVLAVNKIDLVDDAATVFAEISAEFN